MVHHFTLTSHLPLRPTVKITKLIVLQAISAALNIFAILFIAAAYGAEVRGSLSVYNNALLLIATIFSTGITSAMTYFIAQQKITIRQALKLSLWCAAAAALMTLLYALVTNTAFKVTSVRISDAVVWRYFAVLQVFAMVSISFCNAILFAQKKAILATTFVIWQVLSFVALVLIAQQTMRIDAATLAKFQAMSYIVPMVLLYVSLFSASKHDDITNTQSISLSTNNSFTQYTLRTYLANVIQFLCYRVDMCFLALFLVSDKLIGNYAIAVLMAQMLWIIPNQIASTYFGFAAAHKLNVTALIGVTRIVFWYSIALALVAYAVAYLALPVLIGKDFSDSALLYLLLIPGAALICSGVLIATYNASVNNIKTNIMGSLIALVFACICYVLFLKKYHVYAAAVISSCAYAITVLYYYIYFCQQHGVSLLKFFSLRNISFSDLQQYWHELQQ